jgi:hypothetical protein
MELAANLLEAKLVRLRDILVAIVARGRAIAGAEDVVDVHVRGHILVDFAEVVANLALGRCELTEAAVVGVVLLIPVLADE